MDQIYVVTKEEVNSSYINKVWTYTTPTILGFAARYDINSDKCNKKNKEQDDWVEREVYNNNGQPTIWAWNYITQKMAYIPFHPKAPLMLDNDPTMGVYYSRLCNTLINIK